MNAKTVKIPNPSLPHLHFWQGYWRLEPSLKGDYLDHGGPGDNWEKAHFWRHRMNNDINNARWLSGRKAPHVRPK